MNKTVPFLHINLLVKYSVHQQIHFNGNVFRNKSYGCIVCVEVLRPSQPNGVMSSAVSLPNHTFTGQA